MYHLATTDNNLGKTLCDLKCSAESAAEVYKDLSAIANIPLKELCRKNPSLIVFPQILGNEQDGIEELCICELNGSVETPEKAKLTTENLMGFIGYGNTQLSIKSRFTKLEHEDCFLHYMLEKVGLVNLFDLPHNFTKDSCFDFLLYLFPMMLQKALAQGLFKTYQKFERNDANVKGVIDVSRHIQKNIPFAGRVAYNTRERTFDNFLTQLIRHTIEFLKTKPNGKAVLTGNHETKSAVNEIIQATPSYSFFDRERIIAINSKSLNHPYFTAYKPLQKLCFAILKHQKLSYKKNTKQIYGILFDGAWLWEEYLATILKHEGFAHPKNKTGSGGIKMFENDDDISFDKNFRRIYPDFYRLKSDSDKGFILDAKYKRLQNGVGRDDLYQVVTYMHTMKIDRGGFVYPVPKNNIEDIVSHQKYQLSKNGYSGEIHLFGIGIPKANNDDLKERYEVFLERMNNAEQKLLNIFSKCF